MLADAVDGIVTTNDDILSCTFLELLFDPCELGLSLEATFWAW